MKSDVEIDEDLDEGAEIDSLDALSTAALVESGADDVDDVDEALSNIIDEPELVVKPKKLKPHEREHYVNGKEFEQLISEYYTTGVISEALAVSVQKIVNGLSYAPNFINYTYRDEMIGDATVKMFSALHNKKFKLNSGFSAFAYFTTIAFHAFINRIKKEKKLHVALAEYKEKVYREVIGEQEIPAGSIYIDPNQHDDSDNS